MVGFVSDRFRLSAVRKIGVGAYWVSKLEEFRRRLGQCRDMVHEQQCVSATAGWCSAAVAENYRERLKQARRENFDQSLRCAPDCGGDPCIIRRPVTASQRCGVV